MGLAIVGRVLLCLLAPLMFLIGLHPKHPCLLALRTDETAIVIFACVIAAAAVTTPASRRATALAG